MNVRREDRAPEEPLKASPAARAALALALFDLALSSLTFWIVRSYYETHVPHFDSIGGYTLVYDVMNAVQRDGLAAAIGAGARISISWLYPVLGLLMSWSPARAPEYLVSVNVILLYVAQLAIIRYGSVAGWGARRIVLVGLLPLLPGEFFVWDGGYQDLRRDAQLTPLLIGCAFLSLAYVRTPTRWSGVALGVVVGLTQWSRDNAAAAIVLATLPAILLALGEVRRRGGRWLAGIAALPLLVFLAIVTPYYACTLDRTIYRYLYVVWGTGHDRLASLAHYAQSPYDVLLGTPRYQGTTGLAEVSAVMLLGGGGVLALAAAFGLLRIDPDRVRYPSFRVLVGAGLLVTVGVILYSSLILGLRAGGGSVVLNPVGVGLVVLLAGLGELVVGTHRAECRRRVTYGVVAVLALLLLVGTGARMLAARSTPGDPADVAEVREAARIVSQAAGNRPAAILWADGFSRHHVDYYRAQAGERVLVNPEVLAMNAGERFDLDQPLRPTDDPAALQDELRRALRRYADVVVVAEDAHRYGDGHVRLWPYLVGQPVVEELLRDPSFPPVGRFTLRGVPFVVLENRPPH